MSEEEIDSGTVGRSIGLAMVPGKHIVKMEIRKKVFFFNFCLAYKFLAIILSILGIIISKDSYEKYKFYF